MAGAARCPATGGGVHPAARDRDLPLHADPRGPDHELGVDPDPGGRILIKHQAVAIRLADMATKIAAVRALLNEATRAVDARSHGESFLRLFQSRLVPNGLYLLDEPEAALSFSAQIALVATMSPARRRAPTRCVAGLPLRKSIRIVESSRCNTRCQPARRSSVPRCARTQPAVSLSHSCSVSCKAPATERSDAER